MESLKNFLSEIGKVISYKARALVHGESGTIVNVEHLGPYDPGTLGYRIYSRDDDGNLPSKITFRNHLGELVTRISKPVLETSYDPSSDKVDYSWNYKLYKEGDIYP